MLPPRANPCVSLPAGKVSPVAARPHLFNGGVSAGALQNIKPSTDDSSSSIKI